MEFIKQSQIKPNSSVAFPHTQNNDSHFKRQFELSKTSINTPEQGDKMIKNCS